MKFLLKLVKDSNNGENIRRWKAYNWSQPPNSSVKANADDGERIIEN